MNDNPKNESAHEIIAILDDGLIIKSSVSNKARSSQTSIGFLSIITEEKNKAKVCGIECKSKLVHSTHLYDITQIMAVSSKYSRVKWNDDYLNYHVPIFYKKAQMLHHAVVCDFDTIFYLQVRCVSKVLNN